MVDVPPCISYFSGGVSASRVPDWPNPLAQLIIAGSYLSLANADRREEMLLELVWEIAKLVLLIAVDGTI